MKIVVLIVRLLLGLVFFVYGLNAFMPSRALYQADSLDSFFRLYSSRTTYWRSLARTILGPVLVNILLYHLLLSPEGLGGALIAAMFWFVLYFHYRCLTGNGRERKCGGEKDTEGTAGRRESHDCLR